MTSVKLSLAALALVCGAAAVSGGNEPAAATHTVTIVDATRFEPAALTVKPGDTIVWVNKDVLPHTATSKAGGFDSGAIAPGKSWKLTVEKSGKFPYICTYHPTMKGTLTVK